MNGLVSNDLISHSALQKRRLNLLMPASVSPVHWNADITALCIIIYTTQYHNSQYGNP